MVCKLIQSSTNKGEDIDINKNQRIFQDGDLGLLINPEDITTIPHSPK